MATRKYRISGRVVERTRRSGVPGVTVEAWDRDTRFHDMLGSEVTDAEGAFSIAFDDDYFGDFAPDRSPDVFFKVLRDGRVVLTTFDKPMMNLADGDTQVTLEIAEAQPPEPGKDRIKTRQMLKATRFFTQSDFKGVMKEQREKGSMLGSFLGALGGKALANFDFAPLRPTGPQTSQVIGQDAASASANLEAQQVKVTGVKTFDPKTDADSARALADFPLRVKAGDRVELYEENGIVRYYAIVKPVAATDVDAATVARLDREVQDLKGEEITQLKAQLAVVQQSAANKDAEIERLRADLAATQAEQRDLSTRFSADKLAALERQVKLLDDRFTLVTPQPAPPAAPQPAPPAPTPRPPVIRGAKPKRGGGR
jgi:hypothetical protein